MSKSSDSNSQWLLADRALTPIVSSIPLSSADRDGPSKQAQTQLQSLTSLTTTAIAAFDSAARLGLGLPQRIFVETQPGGPVVLHAFLNPPSRKQHASRGEATVDDREIVEQTRDDLRPLTATTDGDSENHDESHDVRLNGAVTGGQSTEEDALEEEDEQTSAQQSPLLVASVVAPSLGDAKRAVGALERTGREIQKALILERQQDEVHDVSEGSSGG